MISTSFMLDAELPSIVKHMRENGVRRIVLDGDSVREVELFDTIPAPPPEEIWGPIGGVPTPAPDAPGPDDSAKPPGMCAALGCTENNGWHFDKRFCPAHGRAAAGVRL